MEATINEISTLNIEELQQRLNETPQHSLIEIKNHCDEIYYNTGEISGLTDEQYDTLTDSITTQLETNPTTRTHVPYHMGSMNKIRPNKPVECATLTKWLSKYDNDTYVIESKLDGVSCLLVVIEGQYKLYKRPGDDKLGSDISHLIGHIKSIPKNIHNIVIRGELIIKKSVFTKRYIGKYNNARNMVSGITGGKTIKDGIRDTEFKAYEVISPTDAQCAPETQMKTLKSIGFSVVKHTLVNKEHITPDTLSIILEQFKKISIYDIDGIVVHINREYKRNTTGNPSYAFAFKVNNQEDKTQATIKNIEWNISKWGKIKPRIQISPIQIKNVTINFVTGFNAKYIYDNNLAPGSIIEIFRSGDVIPHIERIIKSSKTPQMPSIDYTWGNTRVDIYANQEKSQDTSIKRSVAFFASLNIKHLAKATIEKLYNLGMNDEIKIIQADSEHLNKLEGFGQKSINRILKNIQEGMTKANTIDVLSASGILGEGIGKKKIQTLFKAIPDILEQRNSVKENIIRIKGFSEKTAKTISSNIIEAYQYIQKIKQMGFLQEKTQIDEDINENIEEKDPLFNKIIIFTGFRDVELENKLKSKGCEISSSINKNTFCIITPDSDIKQSSKLTKAQNTGIQQFTKSHFNSVFNL